MTRTLITPSDLSPRTREILDRVPRASARASATEATCSAR